MEEAFEKQRQLIAEIGMWFADLSYPMTIDQENAVEEFGNRINESLKETAIYIKD